MATTTHVPGAWGEDLGLRPACGSTVQHPAFTRSGEPTCRRCQEGIASNTEQWQERVNKARIGPDRS